MKTSPSDRCVKPQVQLIKFFSVIFLLAASTGCAKIIEGTKGFAGVSTKAIEDKRKEGIVREFDLDYPTCLDRVKAILEQDREPSYIYAQDPQKKMLGVYVSKTDTTVVGIFFTEVAPQKTRIEVSSASKFGKEFISKKISYGIETWGKVDKKRDNVEKDRPF